MTPDHSQNPLSSGKTLKQRIMRRIYLVFMVRNVAPLAFDVAAFAIIAFVITLFVSVKDVLANLSTANAHGNVSGFSIAAFSGTKLLTKFLLFILGVVGFLAVRHLKRAFRALRVLQNKTHPKEKPPVRDADTSPQH